MKSALQVSFSVIILSVFSSSCGTTFISSNKSYYPEYSNVKEYKFNQLKINSLNSNSKLSTNTEIIKNNPIKLIDELNIKAIKQNIFIDKLLDFAKTFLGTRYRMGGTTKGGIDCSSFVQQVFNSAEIDLPRVSYVQAKEGKKIPLSEVKKGDLLFFNTRGRGVSHVAIVDDIDENGVIFFIHAASSIGVSIASLNNSYWSRKFLFAKRIISINN